jgi:hypothetical protein
MIPVERLEALPQTRLCVKCSAETGGDVRLRITTRKQGKSGSLKSTGEVIDHVEWVRREIPLEEE